MCAFCQYILCGNTPRVFGSKLPGVVDVANSGCYEKPLRSPSHPQLPMVIGTIPQIEIDQILVSIPDSLAKALK